MNNRGQCRDAVMCNCQTTDAGCRCGEPDAAPAAGSAVRLSRNAAGQLELHLDGRGSFSDVRVARCFPWSLPQTYISIRDEKGKEVLLLRTLDELDEQGRQLVAQELADKVFNPKILRVTDYKQEFGVTSITAMTDRGEVTFQIRSRDDVRLLSPTRALFRDADGNTYELENLAALDPASRKHFAEFF